MTWSVSTDPLDFDEAVAWFRKRVAMTRGERDALEARARYRAFFVSNIAQLDLVEQVWKAVDKAVASGLPLKDFKEQVGSALRSAWGGTVKAPAWRLETIFRTNVQNAYGAGRFRQAIDPDVLEDRPVWMFDAILDGRETDVCKACDGTKLPANDKWWKSHLPPLHHNCRSSFIALAEDQVDGLTKQPPKASPKNGFGSEPVEDERAIQLWANSKIAAAPAPLAKAAGRGVPPAPPPSGGGDGNGGESGPPPWHTDGKKRLPGKLDESDRHFSPEERRIADVLIADGNDVKSRSEKARRVGSGRKFDGWVNDADVEFKTPKEVNGVRRQILKSTAGGVRQAPNLIVDARGLAFSEADANALMRRIWPELEAPLDYVRIIGDTFDRTYSPRDAS